MKRIGAVACLLVLLAWVPGCGNVRRRTEAPLDGAGRIERAPVERTHTVGDEITRASSGLGGDCIPCAGRGFFPCAHCGEEGLLGSSTCGFCEGAGRINGAVCPICAGSGRQCRRICRVCDGDGRIDCQRCCGTGHSLAPEVRTDVLATWIRSGERLPDDSFTRGGSPDAAALNRWRAERRAADERRREETRRAAHEAASR